tara:strand:+ start:42 stop:425 length:384 start_codon:yes stop_codon:yes gene_type:complete
MIEHSYTVQIVIDKPTHYSKNIKCSVGDIVGIYSLISEKPAINRRLAFAHIHDVPIDVDFQALLSECVRIETDDLDVFISKSAWWADLSKIPMGAEKICDMAWVEAKNHFKRKSDSITIGDYYKAGR